MSDDNRFFRSVWRFNAIVIALVALGSLAMVGIGAWMQFGAPYDWKAPAGHFAPVPKTAEQKYTYRLAPEPLDQLAGTHEQLFVLRRWEGDPQEFGLADVKVSSSYRGIDIDDVNLLLVDDDTGDARWLFPGYERLIASEQSIDGPNLIPGTQVRTTVGLIIDAVDADTDKDGKLTERDRHTLYGYRLDTGRAVKIVSADLILGTRQIGTDRLVVTYEDGKAANVAIYSLSDFKLISQKPLPDVPK